MNTLAKKDDKRYQYKIYKICSDECEHFYIGSTRDITSRKNKHKSVCNNVNNKEYNCKKYQTIRANGGWDNFRMVVIEVMENTTKLEAEMREEVVRVELNAKMNSQRATRGDITLQEYQKKHYIENREHYQEYKKQHYIDNKETIQEYKKQHYIDNKEKILEQKKQYRINNKEQIREKAKQKHDCECGGKYTQQHKTEHMKSKKHQKYISTLNNL